MTKHRKNKYTTKLHVYTGYIRMVTALIKFPPKMKEDLQVIAKEQGKSLSQMIRDDALQKCHTRIVDLNRKPSKKFTVPIEEMPTRSTT